VLLLLLCSGLLTMGLKVTYYMLHRQEAFELRQQSDVDAFMRQHDWLPLGNVNLDITGIIQARRYVNGGCPGEIKILVMDPTGDTAGVIDDLAQEDEQLFFVHDGVTSKVPSDYTPFKQELGRVLQSLQLPLLHTSLYLAIAAPTDCPIKTTLPWSTLP
jgi:hypothetical protein